MSEKVICPECQKEGAKSKCTELHSFKTAVYYPKMYDESGERIENKDRNKTATHYQCSRGHTFEIER